MYYTTKSFWLTGSVSANGSFLDTVDRYYFPTSRSIASSGTGWTVAKTASGSYAPMTASVTVAATTFTTTIQPRAIPDAVGTAVPADGWIFGPFAGTFAASPFKWQIEANGTTINSQAGYFQWKLWKSADVSGSSTTALTTGFQTSSLRAIAANGTYFSGSFTPLTSIRCDNEYLILEMAWAITTAGGANGCNVIVQVGSSSWFNTPAFEDNSLIILSDDNNPGLQ